MQVDDAEKLAYADQLKSSTTRPVESEAFFKVDFERVPDLVEKRRVFLRQGKAYLPVSEQQSLIVAEFSSNLEKALEVILIFWYSDIASKPPKLYLALTKMIVWCLY